MVYSEKQSLQNALSVLTSRALTLGLVPTMGALHDGHLTLVKTALAANDSVVVSIFVNPTQFDNSEDLANYPRTLTSDIDLLKDISSDRILVYTPTIADIYGNRVASETFHFGGLEDAMEGQFRRGHFNGVATVVKRLFEIIKPNNAYFGEKDFQQLQIVKKLVKNTQMPVNIITCKTHREPSGLAMSSRNTRLKAAHRDAAPFIYKTMIAAKKLFDTNSAKTVVKWVEQQFENHHLLTLEYVAIADETTLKPTLRKSKKKDYRMFIAVYAGYVRLIDTIALN